jgi:signal transduction histidine kinase
MAWPLLVGCLAVAVAATIGDEISPRVPEVVLGLVGIGALTVVVLAGGDRLVLVIALLLAFRGAAFGSQWESAVVLTAAIGLTVLAGITEPGLPAEIFVVVGIVVSWAAGNGAREIVHLVRQMRATEQRLAEDAAREERRRLAREVHDVIAHSMTVTLLHVSGARLALRDEPEAADHALQRAERFGRASLEDLRRTVKLLSESSDPTLGTSVDLADDLERLCDSFSAAGAKIQMQVTGETEGVPPYVALTVFRIVQESITNAMRHARGCAVCVEVDAGEERVSLRVENSMGSSVERPNGSGRGLHGMFERAALLDGHIEAGPTKEGWLVAGWVPRDAPPGGVETA